MTVFGIVVVVGGSVVEVVAAVRLAEPATADAGVVLGPSASASVLVSTQTAPTVPTVPTSATAAMIGASFVPLILDPPPRGDDALTPLS
jgi:hypothetical protein